MLSKLSLSYRARSVNDSSIVPGYLGDADLEMGGRRTVRSYMAMTNRFRLLDASVEDCRRKGEDA